MKTIPHRPIIMKIGIANKRGTKIEEILIKILNSMKKTSTPFQSISTSLREHDIHVLIPPGNLKNIGRLLELMQKIPGINLNFDYNQITQLCDCEQN